MKKKSVNNWIKKHINDMYVKEANNRKYRSRAWFKLSEINKKNNIFSPNMTVLDLGAAPGGWSQYISNIYKKGNIKIIACDILPMKPIIGVQFIQGDFNNPNILEKIIQCIGKNIKVQVILSDMSPNISGISYIDIPKFMILIENVLNVCIKILAVNGVLILKVFQGHSLEEYIKKICIFFKIVKICKPNASRSYSREVFIMARGFKL